jgi:putative addiction module CopG family antidote
MHVEVSIPDDMKNFVEELVHAGSFRDTKEVVGEALRALKRQEELRRAIRIGIDELDRGDYVEYNDASVAQFQADIIALEKSRYADKGKGK